MVYPVHLARTARRSSSATCSTSIASSRARTTPAQKLTITRDGDGSPRSIDRRIADLQAEQVAFSRKTAWRSPSSRAATSGSWTRSCWSRRSVTNTPEEERDPVFSPEGDASSWSAIRAARPTSSASEQAEPAPSGGRTRSFKLERLTQDAEVEADLKW